MTPQRRLAVAGSAAEQIAASTDRDASRKVARADKDSLAKRLHRIEGQVRGINRMIDEDRYCIDVLTQISAVTTALDSLAFQILDGHVQHCVARALASGDAAVVEEKSSELLAAVHRFAKTR